MKKLTAALPFLLLIAWMPERSPYDRLPNDAAGAVVRRAIERAGGWKSWASKMTVVFQLAMRRLRPDGSVEESRLETHRYRLRPQLGIRIEWQQGGQDFILVNNGRFASKMVGGSEDFSAQAGRDARDATFRAEYDFGLPFKLTDPGTHLEYLGQSRFKKGEMADRIRVTYDKGAGDAGGLHTWTFFFDAKSAALLASQLNYGPGKFEFTEYSDEQQFGDIRKAARQVRYDADATGKKGPPIYELTYQKVQFDVPLDDALFLIPPRSF